MGNIPQYVCGVIPPHILTRVAEHTIRLKQAAPPAPRSSTCASWPRVAPQRSSNDPPRLPPQLTTPRKRRNVYAANHTLRLPGKLVMSEHKPRGTDVEVNEAYDGSGSTYDFFANVFRRSSIDGSGMRLDSTVHYGTSFENALWNGRQMVYGHARRTNLQALHRIRRCDRP